MKYRRVGKTDIEVSAVAFGGMRFHSVPEDEALAILRRALELGINFFETGPLYGENALSETLFGKAFKEWGKEVHVATKVIISEKFAATADQARVSLEESLKRLQLDRVDFFGGWSMSKDAWDTFFAKGGPLEGIRKAQDEGLVGHIYGSSHDRPENVVKWLERGEIEAITIPYNAAKRHFRPVIDYCRENEIGCFTMQSTHGGLLAETKGRLGELLRDKAESPALAAQRWLLAHKGITAPLIGFTGVDQVETSTALADEVDELEAAGEDAVDFLADFAQMAENLCNRCNYCAGCPVEIPIVRFLQQFQMWQILRDDDLVAAMTKSLAVGPDACTDCGACEEKCPSNLPIRELLKEMSGDLERVGITVPAE